MNKLITLFFFLVPFLTQAEIDWTKLEGQKDTKFVSLHYAGSRYGNLKLIGAEGTLGSQSEVIYPDFIKAGNKVLRLGYKLVNCTVDRYSENRLDHYCFYQKM